MFAKIDIKKFGLYKDYRWPGNLADLSKVNIIYGRNYSGKTTLSRIFDSISMGQLHRNYQDGDFVLFTDNPSVPTITQNNITDCPYAIRVYNSDFVNRTFDWFKNEEEGEIKSFTLMGSKNVEAQKAIEEIDDKLGSVEERKGLLYEYDVKYQEYSTAEGQYNSAYMSLENQLKTKANGDIKRQNYYVKQGINYNINNIKADIEDILKCVVKDDNEERGDEEGGEEEKFVFHSYSLDESAILTDEAKFQMQKTVDEARKTELEKLKEAEAHIGEYSEQVRELVTKKITLTKTLKELVEDDLLQAWVDQGRELNKDKEFCAFCGNPISKERWEVLNAHFSKESEDLKQSLIKLNEKLENASKALDGFLESKGLVKDNIYVANAEEFDAVLAQWNDYLVKYKKAIGRLQGMIEERLANIFKPIEISEQISYDEELVLTPILQGFNALIEKNNAYGLELDSKQQAARDKLRLDAVYQFCTDIRYTTTLESLERQDADVKTKGKVVERIEKEIDQLKIDRKQKELDKKDEGKAALKVTKLLVNHFGNGSLTLEPVQVDDEVDEETGDVKPRTIFIVKRGGQNAKNLSEGEKSLISFCYFIAQMDDELNGPDAGNLVIFIDDPISSLDSSHIFFMYSLIDTVIAEPRKYGQLIISTHNLEFLKFLKRLDLPGTWGRKEISHYVVAKLRKGDTDDYKCEIKEMPQYLKDYVTEYNFLFQQIYEIAKPINGDKQALYGNKYSQYYNIGNNMRKFLECYLFYRYPDTEDPIKHHMKQLFDDEVPSEVNRVVNEYSHLVWAERGLRVVDVPEIEKAAKHILKALKEKDGSHFETLCKSVGADVNIDLSITG